MILQPQYFFSAIIIITSCGLLGSQVSKKWLMLDLTIRMEIEGMP
jgi:hypothetical protein